MARKILINGRRAEELRVAIVENQTLEDFEIETKRSGLLRNNIYRGIVSNIAPSLNAAFVDFGDQKNGFLAFNDVVESAYAKPVKDATKISDVLVQGQTIMVQVIKDATGLKGAQVTTNISLAGRYLVLRPKDAKSGVSRKVDEDARADLTQKVRSLDLPEGYGCIVRTNAMDQSRAILLRDAKVLVQLWHKIETEFAKAKTPALLYNDQDIVVQVMRDYFDSTINEVLIDDKPCYDRALAYVRATIASSEDKIKFYDDRMPLFTRYGIERQIEQIYARTVELPSGGFIVIDPTEALTAIDVNSAHSTKRESQDLTAYHTNLEAAVEIGRQLRMRDIGGLIVIDFIDMRFGKHQRDVERVMRNAMARDKARNKVERISANGLLEINRQRLSQTLAQRTHLVCPTCGGRGFIPSAEAIGLNLIREIDARATNNNGVLGGVIIKLHPDIAEQVQNERRRDFAQLENDYNIRIEIVASKDMSRGDESIEWLTQRQEDELHPELVKTAACDAASIVDVAEAYQAQETEDESYRPNDYEEFSSEEARKKRAARRSGRKEIIEAPVAADKENKKSEPSVAAEKESKKSDAPKESAQASAKSQEKRYVHTVSGLALLAAFVEQMAPYVDEPVTEKHRHFTFKGRRRGHKTENVGIRTDFKFFAIDLVKAVLALDEKSNDLDKNDIASHIPVVSEWLLNAARSEEGDRLGKLTALRSLITSHHASIRMKCLFDAKPAVQPDELTQILIEERNLIFSQSEDLTPARIQALAASLSAKCASVFGKNGNAPISFDLSDMEQEPAVESKPEKDSAPKKKAEQAKRTEAEDTPIKPQPLLDVSLDDEEDGLRRNRRRSRTRRAIGEELSPYVGENAPVITSDVIIKPMTLIDEDPKDSETDQDITQEMPAVSRERSSRRVRRTREDRRRNREEISAADNQSEKTDPVRKTEAEVVEQLSFSFTSEPTPAQPVLAEIEKERLSRKRERRTQRARIGEEISSADIQTPSSPVAELEPVTAAHELKPDVYFDEKPSRENRRNRNSRANRNRIEPEMTVADAIAMDAVDAAHDALMALEVKETAVQPDPAPEVSEKRTRRTRKTKPVKAETQDIQQEMPAEAISEQPQLKLDQAQINDLVAPKSENKSVRRVRKTKAARLNPNEFNAQETPVGAEPQAVSVPEPVQLEMPIPQPEPEMPAKDADREQETEPTSRHARRVRRSSARRQMTLPESETVTAQQENIPAQVEVIHAQTESPAIQPESPNDEETSSESMGERSRRRRTRRARPED